CVGEPADCGSAAGEHAKVQKNATKRHTPESKGVETRESHIARADLQWQDVICETEHYRHDDEKDHCRAVHGKELIERVGLEKVVVRHDELEADEQRFGAADYKEDQSGQHVENSDALVINGSEPREAIVCALGRIEDCVPEFRDCGGAVHRSVERYSLSWFSCSSVKLKSGMSAPGLIACGFLIHRCMFAGVFSRIPAPSCLRLPTCVRSGATRKSAPATPRTAWQLMQVDV